MYYKNTAKTKKLIAVRMKKVWVAPGQIINLNSTDVRMLGSNGLHMKPVGNIMPRSEKPTKKVEKEPEETKTTPKVDNKTLRKELKEKFENMTKVQLIDFGENQMGYDVKNADKKAVIIKKLLDESKKQGYSETLEKVG